MLYLSVYENEIPMKCVAGEAPKTKKISENIWRKKNKYGEH